MSVTFSLPEFNLKNQIRSSWEFHVDDHSESQAHIIWLLVTRQDLLGELSIIMNFIDHTVTWDTDTIQMKDRDTALYHQ
jgi:hypothetical protein